VDLDGDNKKKQKKKHIKDVPRLVDGQNTPDNQIS
jgi:hypothetical protein